MTRPAATPPLAASRLARATREQTEGPILSEGKARDGLAGIDGAARATGRPVIELDGGRAIVSP